MADRYEVALAAGKALRESPHAVMAAAYQADDDRLVLTLRSGVEVTCPRSLVSELDAAPPERVAEVTVTPLRDGLYWEALDVSISAQGLLADLVGAVDARAAGRKGGSATSEAKARAVRVNGKKGGRPKKQAG